jgi:hypothetical protein
MSEYLNKAVAALEKRVRELEDRLAIYQLLSTYGPAVDSGESRAAANLWAEDGVYDVGGMYQAKGHDAIAALYDAKGHQDLIHAGSAHATGMPNVKVNGDTAQAVAYSQVLLKDGDGFKIWRNSANRWDLVRTDKGWKINLRYNRVLDGSQTSHDVIRAAVK